MKILAYANLGYSLPRDLQNFCVLMQEKLVNVFSQGVCALLFKAGCNDKIFPSKP